MVSLQLGKVLADDDHLQVRLAVIIFVLIEPSTKDHVNPNVFAQHSSVSPAKGS